VLWLKVGLDGLTCQAGRPASMVKFHCRTDFGHWIPRALTFLDMLAKRNLKRRQHLASQPAKEMGLARPTLARLGMGFVPYHPLVSYSL
jgi:hypothetical protein